MVSEAQRELVRIGIDRAAGSATGPIDYLAGAHPISTYPVRSFADLAAARTSSSDHQSKVAVDPMSGQQVVTGALSP